MLLVFLLLVWFEPTCVMKSRKPFQLGCHGRVSVATPNLLELRHMHSSLTGCAGNTAKPQEGDEDFPQYVMCWECHTATNGDNRVVAIKYHT